MNPITDFCCDRVEPGGLQCRGWVTGTTNTAGGRSRRSIELSDPMDSFMIASTNSVSVHHALPVAPRVTLIPRRLRCHSLSVCRQGGWAKDWTGGEKSLVEVRRRSVKVLGMKAFCIITGNGTVKDIAMVQRIQVQCCVIAYRVLAYEDLWEISD